jgi:hypothetical protein
MTSDEREPRGEDESAIVDDMAVLMRECLEKVRRQDPPEAWPAVYAEIDELQSWLDRRVTEGVECTYCGARRPTARLHAFGLYAPSGDWSLCDGSPTLAWGPESATAVWSDPPSFIRSYKVWPTRVMTAAMWRAWT